MVLFIIKMGFIYKITNIINNHFYIGQTKCKMNSRFRSHKYNAKNIKNKNNKFYNAINKYGIDNFKIEVLKEVLNNDELDENEIFYIKNLKPKYNTSDGGKRTKGFKGKKLSKSHLESLIKSNIKPIYQYNLDGTFYKEWESCKSAQLFYNKRSINHCINNKQLSASGYLWSKIKKDFLEPIIKKTAAKKIVQLDKNNQIIKIWNSAVEAESQGFKSEKISLVCNNKREYHKNYKWKFYYE